LPLAQAKLARLGDNSCRGRDEFLVFFAQARAARLGENIRFPICFHMQSLEIQTKNSNLAQTSDSSINQEQVHAIKVIRMVSIRNSRKSVSSLYLFIDFKLGEINLNQ